MLIDSDSREIAYSVHAFGVLVSITLLNDTLAEKSNASTRPGF